MNALTKIVLLCTLSVSTWASEVELEKVEVEKDLPSIERGAELLIQNCHSCHSLKYIRYADLNALGIDKKKVDEWRADQPLEAGMMAQMSENDAIQGFGKAPPDLSLMTKARDGGVHYVYSYLLAYYNKPDGMLGNHVYPATKMPDPLGISGATDDAQRNEIKAHARDIVSFLAWASDPHEADRTKLGYYTIIYLLILTILLYFVKVQIWSRLK